MRPPGTTPLLKPGRAIVALTGLVLALITVAAVHGCSSGRSRPRGKPGPLYAFEARSDHGMVSSGSVEATRAGVAILEQGGNAVDAAVAAAFALGVSDPGGSGLGGFTYMLIAPSDGPPIAVDGSTPAPLAADPAALLAIRREKKHSGYAGISVPTTPATLAHALERYGTMELAEVLAPAIEIADEGYRLGHNSIVWARIYLAEIRASSYLRFIVLRDGEVLGRAGDRICRPDLRRTLLRLARDGVETFYRGSMAAEITADVTRNGGFIQAVDLASYRVREHRPLRSSYRGAELLSFPFPGGGGEVVEALNILQQFPTAALARPTVERLQLLVEAARIAQVDSSLAIHSVAGGEGLFGRGNHLSERHARERAALITPGRSISDPSLVPPGATGSFGDNTTHLSVVDRDGNAVSLTQTLCRVYGAKVATPGLGFPYNCCLESLDFENPDSPFHLRPRGLYPTNMAPSIVRTGDSVTVLGGAGSDRIASTLTEVISNMTDRRMGLREAVTAPRVLWNGAHDPPRICLEIADPITEADADRLQSFGFEHMFRLRYPPRPDTNLGFFGGVNAVAHDLRTGVFTGVGDPRRGGFALGPRAVAEAPATGR